MISVPYSIRLRVSGEKYRCERMKQESGVEWGGEVVTGGWGERSEDMHGKKQGTQGESQKT